MTTNYTKSADAIIGASGSPQLTRSQASAIRQFIAERLGMSDDNLAAVIVNEWIIWAGGVMPVEYGTLVDVRHRDGEEFYAMKAGRGAATEWDHDNADGDIMAYRICP